MEAQRRYLRYLWLALVLAPLPASGETVRIYVTNAAGDNIHVIDPATNKVVQELKGPEAAHGIAFAPDGSGSMSATRPRPPSTFSIGRAGRWSRKWR